MGSIEPSESKRLAGRLAGTYLRKFRKVQTDENATQYERDFVLGQMRYTCAVVPERYVQELIGEVYSSVNQVLTQDYSSVTDEPQGLDRLKYDFKRCASEIGPSDWALNQCLGAWSVMTPKDKEEVKSPLSNEEKIRFEHIFK